MRVLVASVSTSAHQPGGVERHLDLVLEALGRLGHEAHVLTTPAPAPFPARPGVRWHAVEGVPPARHGGAWLAASAAAARRLNASLGFGALLSETLSGAGLSDRACAPWHAAFVQGFEPEHALNRWKEVRGPLDFLRYAAVGLPETAWLTWLERSLLRRVDRVLCAAPHLEEKVRRYYGVPSSKVEPFPNWVSPERYRRDEDSRAAWRAKLEIEPGETVFLFSAVLSRQKGGREALEAFDRHAVRNRKSRLLIAGDGPELPALKVRTLRLGRVSRVHFLGLRPSEEMPAVYSAADAFLMPTLRIEGMPFVLLEASAAGLPTAATPLGGNPAVLGEHALWVSPGDEEGLSRAMDQLADSAELRLRLGEAAKERVLSLYSEAGALRRLARILETAAAGAAA